MSKIKVGIGFATGRKSFRRVLRTYISNWTESGLVQDQDISLNLYVAYDLSYNKTKEKNYTNLHPDALKHLTSVRFIGNEDIDQEIDKLVKDGVFSNKKEGRIFGKGYAGKRNAVLYFAIKDEMDYLIFLDDDEYPVCVTNTRKTAVWGGQHVLETHLKNIKDADITHGHHCGYISPIPYIDYNNSLQEKDFKLFIEAISNDIVNWHKIKSVMNDGGVTYADTKILTQQLPYEVQAEKGMKFISGSNLCLNLKDPMRTNAFYNPPRARGEDTFLSTLLNDRKVIKVPCYTFHDGFSTYNCLMEGVLPIRLSFIKADNEKVIQRFLKACIGWVRYKPLLLYITDNDNFEIRMDLMQKQLEETIPKIVDYFKLDDFTVILNEFHKYRRNVKKHYEEFLLAKNIWEKVINNQQLKR